MDTYLIEPLIPLEHELLRIRVSRHLLTMQSDGMFRLLRITPHTPMHTLLRDIEGVVSFMSFHTALSHIDTPK
jgi:hypothetical protein